MSIYHPALLWREYTNVMLQSSNVNVLALSICFLFTVRKYVGQLPAERWNFRESGAAHSGRPWCHGELWHVCVGGHSYIIHAPGGDLLPICHRYASSQSIISFGPVSNLASRGHTYTVYTYILVSSAVFIFCRYYGRLQQIWRSPGCTEVHPCGNYFSYYHYFTCLYPYFGYLTHSLFMYIG